MSSDMDGTSHVSDGDPNVLNANRNDDGRWLNTNWDKPGNQWNDDGVFAFPVPQLSSFLAPSIGGVEFCKLPMPSAEHPADLVHLLGKRDVLLRLKRFRFPKDHQKYFQRLPLSRRHAHVRCFLLPRKKRGGGDRFHRLDEQIVYFVAERIAMQFRQGRMILMPQNVSDLDALKQRQNPLGGLL